MKDALFKDSHFIKKTVGITLPFVFQNIMLASVALSDTVMLGSLEQNAMSAVSFASQIQFIQNMFFTAIVSPLGSLGAQYWGKKDKITLNELFCISLRVAGLVSIVFFMGCILFPETLMKFFTNEQVLVEYGVRYLKIAGFSYLVTGISQCYLTVMKVSEHIKESAVVSSLTVVLNIVLNAVFIFGLLGAPSLGIEGAALATLISRIIELMLTVILSYSRNHIYPKLSNFVKVNRLLKKDFYRCSLPILGACLFWGTGLTAYSSFMGHLGTDAAGANSVAAVIRDLICCFSGGMCSSSGIIVGNELGAGNLERGKLYGERLKKLAFMVAGAAAVIILLLTPVIPGLTNLTDEAKKLLTGMMVVIAVYMIGRGVNDVTISGIFIAGGDTMFDFYSLAVCMWGIAIPLALLGTFVFHWNPVIVFACTCLDEVGKLPWVLYHFKKYRWVKDLTRERI